MSEASERIISQEFKCYFDVYAPPNGGKRRPLVIALHGYGGDKVSMMWQARKMLKQDCVIASLQGPHQHLVYPKNLGDPLKFGFGWLTSYKPHDSIHLHHQTVTSIIDSLTEEGLVDPNYVFLMAFSQSVALNFRFAFTFPERIRGVIGICGGIPGDLQTNERFRQGQFDVLYVAGERDEFYTPDRTRANAAALEAWARKVTFRLYECGHEVPKQAYSDIDSWLAQRLNGE
ncbi:MAG: hypothetical protein K1Y36_03770 [Blastocatellia bacterium]|nr:hypothetical protein [Blastocatellia bacterium]